MQTLKLEVFFSETLPKYNANYFFLIFEFLFSCGRAVRQAPQSSVVWEECTFLSCLWAPAGSGSLGTESGERQEVGRQSVRVFRAASVGKQEGLWGLLWLASLPGVSGGKEVALLKAGCSLVFPTRVFPE